MRSVRVAQFIGLCRWSQWSTHLTHSPVPALSATDGSNAGIQDQLGLFKRRQLTKVAQKLEETGDTLAGAFC